MCYFAVFLEIIGFYKIYVLKVREHLIPEALGQGMYFMKFLQILVRQFLRTRYVLSSHNGKRIFAITCVISYRTPAKKF